MNRIFFTLLATSSSALLICLGLASQTDKGKQILSSFFPSSADHLLTDQGLGKIRYGMTVKIAEKALKTKLNTNIDAEYNCGYAKRADGKDSEISYMVEDGKIVRVEISDEKQSPVKTTSGLGISTTGEELKRAYGQSLDIEPAPYMEENAWNFIVDDATHSHGIIFHVKKNKVDSIMAGLYPALGYEEGCL